MLPINGFSQDVPFVGLPGFRTPFGLMSPVSGKVVAYVRDTAQSGDSIEVEKLRVRTLAAALKLCRSGAGDIVIVLPGHSEDVTDATMMNNLVDGTVILGVGDPRRDDAPTFSWTATAAQWAISKKNVTIAGLRLLADGANGIVKAIAVTGAGFSMVNNYCRIANGASLKSTIFCEIGSGATDALIKGNVVRGTETHNVTDGFLLAGANVPSGLVFEDNDIIASATAGNGLLRVSVAAKRLSIKRNTIYNTHTSSTAAIAVANVAADGVISDNYLGTLNNGTAASQGIVFTSTGALIKCFQNFSCDEPRASGALAPAAVAT